MKLNEPHTDSFSAISLLVIGMCAKDCGWSEDVKDTLQNSPNKGHETKAAFQVSFELRRPSVALDDPVFQGEVKKKKV